MKFQRNFFWFSGQWRPDFLFSKLYQTLYIRLIRFINDIYRMFFCRGRFLNRKRRIQTRKSYKVNYLEPQPRIDFDNLRHECLEGRLEIGPFRDCCVCRWKDILKPVRAICNRLVLSEAEKEAKKVQLKRVKCEHPLRAGKKVRAKTRPGLTVKG